MKKDSDIIDRIDRKILAVLQKEGLSRLREETKTKDLKLLLKIFLSLFSA